MAVKFKRWSKTFAKWARKQRKAKKWTVSKLAMETGMSRSTVYNVEMGYKPVSDETVTMFVATLS